MAHPLPSRNLPSLTNVQQTTILPLEKTAHVETIDPAMMDSFTPEYFLPVLFTYRLADKSEAAYSQTVKRIKESLSKVLVQFFSFAGRWVAVSPGSATRQLLCNDEGVPFIEAYMDTDIDSVVKASAAFQPVPELQGHSLMGMDSTQLTQKLPPDGRVPAVFVQVTHFKCGGLALAVTFNHMHVDGKAFFSFMRAWSDLSRTNETAVTVDHNRAQLLVPSLKALFLHPAVAEQLQNAASLPQRAVKSFEVAASTIKALKEEAKRSGDGPGYVSTGDCIVAHLWSSLQRLRATVLAEKDFVLTRVVEGRARFYDPPVPDVCANVTTWVLQPQIPNPEVAEMPLVSVASKLREQVDSTKREDWLRMEVVGNLLMTLGRPDLQNFNTISWFKFGMYDIDFGFGKPYFGVGPNSYASPDELGTAIIYPPIPSSGPSSVATVNIWCSPDVLQALEDDPQFLQFFLSSRSANGNCMNGNSVH